MDALLDFLQWPAMLVTFAASWLVGSTHRRKRVVGFCTFLLSNALWTAWGWHTDARALVVLQGGLAVLNVRGLFKGEQAKARASPGEPAT
jgi:hypothetical protein